MQLEARPSSPIAAPTRRGLSRVEAAGYVGVSPSTFDKMVSAREMPAPKRIGSRTIWDVRALDLAFDALPSDDSSPENNDWD
jgi:excisionase family DNA binding protein